MHQEQHTRRQGRLYRSRRGVIFGVIRGIADYFDLDANVLRVVTVLLAIFPPFWLFVWIGYFGLALLLKPAPPAGFKDEEDEEFYSTYATSRKMALQRLKRTFDHLERRIQRMETIVTDRRYDWEERLRNG